MSTIVVDHISDVFNAPDWPLFSKRTELLRFPGVNQIGVVSFSLSETGARIPLPDQVRLLWQTIKSDLGGRLPDDTKYVLFVAQPAWLENTAVIRHRGLWSMRKDVTAAEGVVSFSDAPIHNNQKIRFAGTLQLTESAVPTMLELCRTDPTAVLIINPIGLLLSPIEIGRLSKSAFAMDDSVTPDWQIDWAKFVAHECEHVEMFVRVTGTHDDRSAFIDFIGQKRHLDRLVWNHPDA